jgi:RNA polymerase sigma factor (sigma-70 family)
MGHLGEDESAPGRGDTTADELLVVRCQLGEHAAFEELIARWHTPLWRYLRRLAGEDDAAADCIQEVWLRVWRGIAGLREGGRLRAWIFGIARRVVMDRLRAKYADVRMVPVDMTEMADVPETSAAAPHAETEEDIDLVHEELARMPFVEREVLVLFYLKELTLGELADVLAVPIGTIKSRLHRARGMLRERLATKGRLS